LEDHHIFKILEYYLTNNKTSNLVAISLIYDKFKDYLSDLNILKLNSFSNGFFDYVTKKYSTPDDNKFFDILTILFKHYNYPLINNRRDFDPIFDYILYISFYNYKSVWAQNNIKSNNYDTNIYILHPNIQSIIPVKLKNIYINLMKVISQVINNNFDSITYNQKFYSDYLHKNIIKILLSEDNSDTFLSISLFKKLLNSNNSNNFNKLKLIVQKNLLLVNIGTKLSWNSLPKKLDYLDLFYKNKFIIYYQNKLNKNILPDNIDVRIKKIIENPFEMYKYLKKERDFIKWTIFISEQVIQLYLIPISISSEDFNHIGKMIFLLFNINEQNIKDQSYINFINFCISHNKLILESNRINMKIKDFFPTLKCNLNLGFLAKHIIIDKKTITFDNNNDSKSPDILTLELKLQITTNKYYKYKAKYLEYKDTKSIIKFNTSDTSSVKPILY
jgi:hypothetical protein